MKDEDDEGFGLCVGRPSRFPFIYAHFIVVIIIIISMCLFSCCLQFFFVRIVFLFARPLCTVELGNMNISSLFKLLFCFKNVVI